MNKTLIAVGVFACCTGLAQAQEVIVKIGSAAPLTGNIAHMGKDNENGARLAIEEYNAKGVTIGGKKVKFELVGEDDAADPKTGNIVAQRLVDEGVKGVVGHLNSGTTIPASRIYNQAHVPMISPSATNVTLTQQGFPYVFRTMANDAQQGSVLGHFATKMGKKVAIIDDRTAYGQGLADEIAKSVSKNGGRVTSREFTNNQATDFSAILTKIKSQNPDVIVYSGMDAQGGPMLKQVKQLGIKAKFITGDGGCTPEFIHLAGSASDSNTYCTQAGLPVSELADKTFKARFVKRFGVDIQNYAPYAYDAAAALIEAMKAAGTSDPEKYLPYLKKVHFKGVTGDVAFDDKGDTKYGAITVYQFKAGSWAPIKP